MVFIRLIFSFLLLLCLSGCQLGYIVRSAYDQAELMRKRVPISYALKNYDLTENQRSKLELTLQVREFMKEKLGLDTSSNFKRYVHLQRGSVTYAVNAAPKNRLEAYTWSFPIIGSVPYKGYFKKELALDEEKKLKNQNLDTHVRGVSAYSTLGWFEDPVYSSMLKMKEHHFVNTLIHETVHANLYIPNESKFNERVASFLGSIGAELFYKSQSRGEDLKKWVQDENHDELLFSEFISKEFEELKNWYEENSDNPQVETQRTVKFKDLKEKFKIKVLPKLKTSQYHWFSKVKLNNALLLLINLYNSDFDELERLANHLDRDFIKIFKELKTLEDVNNPEQVLKNKVQKF